MTYKALYREWRPLTFDDMVEQKHVVQTLKNAIVNDRIAHAYLFCGTRGTGKTSCAQIMSKAVNCENHQNGNPCNVCDTCKRIGSGTIRDVVEIDAASNNSVNNIRELREEVQYLPTTAKYKVYIIDEVHMLSTGAFNALLKTLEEPPSHVIFILATTEPHKLPATILSRCQRFDFRQISISGIVARLKKVIDTKYADITDDALHIIAQKADGALRDALSLLDQCMSSGFSRITRDDVIEMLGSVNDHEIISVCQSIIQYDIGNLFIKIGQVTSSGKKVSVLLDELIMFFRNMLITMTVDNPDEIIRLSGESILNIKQLAKNTTPERVIFIISELSKLENQIKWAALPKVVLEAGLVSICIDKPVTLSDETLESRIKGLEMKLDIINTFQNNATYQTTAAPVDTKNTLTPILADTNKSLDIDNHTIKTSQQDAIHSNENNNSLIHTENIIKATVHVDSVPEHINPVEVNYSSDKAGNITKDTKECISCWKACLDLIFEEKSSLYYCLTNTKAYEKDELINIFGIKDNPYIKMQLSREEHINLIKQVLYKNTGKYHGLKFIYSEPDPDTDLKSTGSDSIQKIKKISEALDIPFEIK